MVDSENPRAAEMIRQNWMAWRESMRMARNLMKVEQPSEFHDRENSERYWSFLPMVAQSMVHDLFSDSAFLQQAPERTQEERLAMVNLQLKEVCKFNDKIEKDLKK
jgi:hypothetical protein